jgi:hypothetical protein
LDWDNPRLAASAAKRAFCSESGQAVRLERVDGPISINNQYVRAVFVRRQSILHSSPKQAFSFGMPKFLLVSRGPSPQKTLPPGLPTRDQASILNDNIVRSRRSRTPPAGHGRGSHRHASCAPSSSADGTSANKSPGTRRSRRVPPLGDAKRSAAGVFGAQFLGVARPKSPKRAAANQPSLATLLHR